MQQEILELFPLPTLTLWRFPITREQGQPDALQDIQSVCITNIAQAAQLARERVCQRFGSESVHD
jgi:hypothetical protein